MLARHKVHKVVVTGFQQKVSLMFCKSAEYQSNKGNLSWAYNRMYFSVYR